VKRLASLRRIDLAIANYFYHKTTRKYVALFGSIFNKLSIVRTDPVTGNTVQQMPVPISYGPYQKFLARLQQDPNLDRKPSIVLPRISFEIVDLQYDGSRKVVSTKKLLTESSTEGSFMYAPAPYNITFAMYVMVKYADDGAQIMEQIVPFFKPEWTTAVNLIEGIDPFDVPIVLNNVSLEDIYEGDFETRRSLVWTLTFTMKAWFFSPVKQKGLIKFVDVRLFDDMPDSVMAPTTIGVAQVTTQPGLTANGHPTSSIDDTIPYEDIDVGDDWGVITIIRDEIDE